jgi:hypothetical protein
MFCSFVTQITIDIEDINDNTPKWTEGFDQMPLSVKECVQTDEVIVKLTAIDADKKGV